MNDWLDFFSSSSCFPVIYLWSYSQVFEQLFLQNSYRVLHQDRKARKREKRDQVKNFYEDILLGSPDARFEFSSEIVRNIRHLLAII